MKTQQSQAAETLECTREHAHSKVLVEPTWLTALSFPPSFKSFRPSFWICVWGRLGQTNHVIIVTSWFSKSSVLKMFFVHTKTHSSVFKFLRFSRAFSKSSVFGGQFLWISVDGRPNRWNKALFSNSSGTVWTRPQTYSWDIFISDTRAAYVGNLGNTFVTKPYVAGGNILVNALEGKKHTVFTEFVYRRFKKSCPIEISSGKFDISIWKVVSRFRLFTASWGPHNGSLNNHNGNAKDKVIDILPTNHAIL